MFLITSANPEYIKFAEIFFISIVKLEDYKKLKKIFVIDHGLSRKQKIYLLSISRKIYFINLFVPKIKSANVHTDEWRKIISYKTKIFLKLIYTGYQPLIYVDVDSYFKNNFLDLLNFEKYNLITCKRSQTQLNANGYELDYIASFFAVKKYNQKIHQFFNSWIINMENIQGPTKETPALCKTLKTFKNSINFQAVQEDILSLYSPNYNSEMFKKCSIFHLKSSNSEDTKERRINRLLDYGINLQLSKRNNLNFLDELRFQFKNSLNSYLIALIIFLRSFLNKLSIKV